MPGCCAGPTSADTSDRTAPQTSIRKLKVRGRTAVVTFRGTDDRSGKLRFLCSIDGSRFRTCKSPMTLKRLKRGAHVFRVKAVDAAGNADRTPAKKRFKVV